LQESRREWLLALCRKFADGNKQYGNYHIWDYTNQPVGLNSKKVIEQKIEYIH
jgi:hypothetical protein